MMMPRRLLISLLVNIWMVELSVSISLFLELAAVLVVTVEAAEEVVAASIEVVAVEEETAVVEAEEVALVAMASEAVVDLVAALLSTTLAVLSFEQNTRFKHGVKQTLIHYD
jgi:hypothetical protein